MAAVRQDWIEAIRNGAANARERAAHYQELAEATEKASIQAFRQARAAISAWITGENKTESADDLLATAAKAGFVETPEMRLLRAQIRLAPAAEPTEESSGKLAEQIRSYNVLADRLESAHGGKFQIGLLLAKAMAWRDAGRPEFFEEDLDDILTHAQGMGSTRGSPFNEVVDVIIEGNGAPGHEA